MEIFCKTPDELLPVAKKISDKLNAGDILLLNGDLGTGKTTMAGAIIRCLTGDARLEVTSPTFNIMQSYQSPKGEIWHYDLYRIKNADELQELALDDLACNSISIIEWPEIAMTIIKNHRHISISLDYAENGEGRILKFSEEI